jgi:hypothetical protein
VLEQPVGSIAYIQRSGDDQKDYAQAGASQVGALEFF